MDVQEIQMMPLEVRARLKKKEYGGTLSALLLLAGFGAAIYYWFIGEFIFSYDTIKPFWGGLLFIVGSFLIAYCCASIASLFYKKYNTVIDDALKEVQNQLDSNSSLSWEQETLFKAALMEPKIGTKEFKTKDFEWYNSNLCWGCAKIFQEAPKAFVVTRTKEESWRSGSYRKSQKFNISTPVRLCPHCFQMVEESEMATKYNSRLIKIAVYSISAVLAIALAVVGIIYAEGDAATIVGSVVFSLITFGFGISLGQIITRPIAYLITKPFQKKVKFTPRWRMDDIPKIYNFQHLQQHK